MEGTKGKELAATKSPPLGSTCYSGLGHYTVSAIKDGFQYSTYPFVAYRAKMTGPVRYSPELTTPSPNHDLFNEVYQMALRRARI